MLILVSLVMVRFTVAVASLAFLDFIVRKGMLAVVVALFIFLYKFRPVVVVVSFGSLASNYRSL